MQNKKGFTLIELMIVVAIIAILAMIAVPMYQRYIERSRNSATQSMLQQMSIALVALSVDTSNYLGSTPPIADTAIDRIMAYGFRPDPNVGVDYKEVNGGASFILYASHRAKGSQTYVYDNVNGSGVMAVFDGTHAADPTDPTTQGLELAAAVPTTLQLFEVKDGSSSTSQTAGSITVGPATSGATRYVTQ